jgi:hypothetical protein
LPIESLDAPPDSFAFIWGQRKGRRAVHRNWQKFRDTFVYVSAGPIRAFDAGD